MKNRMKALDELDDQLFQAIVDDITNETLLTKADSMTQKLLLIGMWEEFDLFVSKGVILGIAWRNVRASEQGGAVINR